MTFLHICNRAALRFFDEILGDYFPLFFTLLVFIIIVSLAVVTIASLEWIHCVEIVRGEQP